MKQREICQRRGEAIAGADRIDHVRGNPRMFVHGVACCKKAAVAPAGDGHQLKRKLIEQRMCDSKRRLLLVCADRLCDVRDFLMIHFEDGRMLAAPQDRFLSPVWLAEIDVEDAEAAWTSGRDEGA